jgi:hypothetical protein
MRACGTLRRLMHGGIISGLRSIKFRASWCRELAIPRAAGPWRRSQCAVPANHRSDRKTARPKSRVRRANHSGRNSRPAPPERLDPRLPRHRRILRPQIGCLRRTAINALSGPAGKYCRASTAILGANNSEKAICHVKSRSGAKCRSTINGTPARLMSSGGSLPREDLVIVR